MKTATVSVGNSDNKLTQKEWSEFQGELLLLCDNYSMVHFVGHTRTSSQFQTFTIVLCIGENLTEDLKSGLRPLKDKYRQNSIALTLGETEFI